MENFQRDIWFQISQHLSPNYLSYINKTLNNLYDEFWQKYFLQRPTPAIDFSKYRIRQ
jgi:hypothetical protein